MKKKIIIACLAAGLFACNQPESTTENNTAVEETTKNPFEGLNQEELKAKVNEFESKVFQNDSSMDITNANLLIEGYVKYANEYPEDSESATFVFKAAEVSLGLNQGTTALALYTKVYEDYPEFEKRPYSLFLQAFINENNLGKLEEARVIYEKFIADYPDHPMADDAQYSLDNLGKSPDELIKEFEAKQKQGV
ncbi:tetratricopeptide repeat protein [Acidiluteibacter ferrifornacis]|uniref:Tetratricopeptide repeat protein n=1 Tax=Acidiluteibacter ferrifornacis TaxID=2692424 RepID=A0A6N9NJW2_9FLAO|nr:tetratricopeptide repeat protein [Acidiluteibacter ferrifornacis]MBR9831159.1 tetratricopeptide repeat protein [bacterium]NBG66978.1 tetratricopeptide repeat protein [Acidiluteibacter ferrifornacis]